MKYIFLIIVFVVGFQLDSFADLPKIDPRQVSSLRLIRNEQEVGLDDNAKAKITAQVVKLFNTCNVSTDSDWLRKVWEKDGKTVEDLWKEITSRSYLELSLQGHLNYYQVVVSIDEDKFSLGNVMSLSPDGKVAGYIKCQGNDHIWLFCMPESMNYLPPAYQQYCNDLRKRQAPDVSQSISPQPPVDDQRYVPKSLVGNNKIFGMKVVKETDSILNVEVDYNYEPGQEDWANLSGSILHKGEYRGLIGFVPARLVPGRHTVILQMNSSGDAPDCFFSDELEITMYEGKGQGYLPDYAKTIFPFKKNWKRYPTNLPENPESEADRGFGFGYGRIGEVRIRKETSDLLELEVKYVYDPQQSRFAMLSASTEARRNERDLDVRIDPGFKTAIIKIEGVVMGPPEYKTDTIRIMILGNLPGDVEDGRLWVDETFHYPKNWSKSSGKEFPVNNRPLTREIRGDGKKIWGTCPDQ